MNGVPLHGDGILFLNNDPNFMLDGLNRFPAGMKLGVSYCYFPLEPLADDPLFAAVLEGVQYFQKTRVCEQKHLDQLEKTTADQKQTIEALQKNLSELHQANAELSARSKAYESSLENILSSSSWKLTLPLRRLLLCRCRRGIQSCRLQLGCQLIHIILRNGIHGVKLLIFCIFGFQQLHICVCLFHHCRCRLCGIFRRLDLPCGCLRGCGCLCLLYLYIASVCGEQQITLLNLLPFFDGNICQIAGDFRTDINLLTFHCAGDKISLLRCFCIVCFCAAGAQYAAACQKQRQHLLLSVLHLFTPFLF